MSNKEELAQARDILESLKSTAVLEEATGFDPSGSGSTDEIRHLSDPVSDADTSPTPHESDATSLSNGLSSASLADDSSTSASVADDMEGIESMDEESKLRLLGDIFPTLSKFALSHALKKHRNRWTPAMTDLLNQVHFAENPMIDGQTTVSTKSVDAFSEDNTGRRSRKRKKQKQVRLEEFSCRSGSMPGDYTTAQPASNKWQTAAEDIHFIAERVNLPTKTVSSIYYQQDASTIKTLTVILKDFLEKNKESVMRDPSMQVDAYELHCEFPMIDDSLCAALVGIAYPSAIVAKELAQALTHRASSSRNTASRVIPQYKPIAFDDDDDHASAYNASHEISSNIDFTTASSQALRYQAAHQAAFNQARAAYRKSKSNHLMGGAAAYYSQVGRDLQATSRHYNAATADALVASQSGPMYIDLHGVTTDDAVRITRVRVYEWWNALGENRVNGRVGADTRAKGFRIVTGAGRHSKGGRGVLGPAVKKFLEQDGWKIDTSSGEILVRGKSRPP